MTNAKRIVLGHACAGLDEHFEYAARSGCIPHFKEDGILSGCDDYNTIAIKFCPYCGTKLKEEQDGRVTEHNSTSASQAC